MTPAARHAVVAGGFMRQLIPPRCTVHHRLFDRGAVGLDPDLRILVSRHMIVRAREANTALMRLVGMPMLPPQHGYEPPAIPYVNWHYWNLFVRPARRPSLPGGPPPPGGPRSDAGALAGRPNG